MYVCMYVNSVHRFKRLFQLQHKRGTRILKNTEKDAEGVEVP